MKSIIEVNHLSKKFRNGELQKYYTLRDALAGILKVSCRLFVKRHSVGLATDEFWALKDISFKADEGEAIGIIGPNGAGKSTLLKILSRITPPTKGDAILRGRVGSLLEVGTGFHQELTGRENIFLSGAILGMTRKEIANKFDEIVTFSGIKFFLDMPVKHYSSGMYMRLAFAVAAHLDTDILIIDEVLAVGDAEFQEKCLLKMNSISKDDKRTVIFVSHNMEAIQKLCDRVILIDHGRIVKEGQPSDITNLYLRKTEEISRTPYRKRTDREGTGRVRIDDIVFKDGEGRRVNDLKSGENAEIQIKFSSKDKSINKLNFEMDIKSFYDQNKIAFIGNKVLRKTVCVKEKQIRIKIDKLPLLPGRYQFSIYLLGINDEKYDHFAMAGIFSVIYGDYYSSGTLPEKNRGYLLINYDLA